MNIINELFFSGGKNSTKYTIYMIIAFHEIFHVIFSFA